MLPSPVESHISKTVSLQEPLIVSHEVVNLPSASVMVVLRAETTTRKPAPKSVAVFVDPVFDPQDARIKTRPRKERQRISKEKVLPVNAVASGVGNTRCERKSASRSISENYKRPKPYYWQTCMTMTNP